MPAPSTIAEFLELVRKSGVVDEKRLAAHMDKLRAAAQVPSEPGRLAGQLVHDGILTHFQAEQFLQGKWRRFTIGKYKVLERLGQGGMGSVYLCEHTLMRRRVAVKVLPAAKAEDSSSLDRFYREARAVAALDHPNIVRAYDIDQDDNLHFLVMEHVDGASLQEMIKRGGPMDVLRVAHYMRQAALGLQHAHEKAGLVHRDIKPGNILVDRSGVVKVLDMGLARFFHDEEDMLTKKYDENVLGTADYLAPEQALDSHAVDIRADIYSLGGTFYYCLTGRTPFADGTVAQKLIWHQTRQPRPIRSLRNDVPEGLVAIIDRMMSKDPNQRYQTPQEVADALIPWTQTPIAPPPDIEMPQLSLAASNRLPGIDGSGPPSPVRGLSDSSAPPRKAWQVSANTPPVGPAQSTPTPAPVVPPREVRPAPPAPAPRAPVTAPARGEGRPAPAAAAAPAVPASAGLVRPPAIAAAPAAKRSQPAPAEQDFPDTEDLAAIHQARLRHTPSKLPLPLIPLLIALAGVIFISLIALIGYLLVFGNRGERKDDTGQRPPIRIPAGQGDVLQNALLRARSGDRFLLEGDITIADVSVKAHNVTLEPAEGRKVVWHCPPKVGPEAKLLIVEGAAGFQMRGITLDGGNRVDALIVLYSACPGVKLEHLQLRNAKKYGIWVTNCQGNADHRVNLLNLDFQTPAQATALRFDIRPHHKSIRVNRYFVVRNCSFNGPGRKVTAPHNDRIDPSSIELPSGVNLDIVP